MSTEGVLHFRHLASINWRGLGVVAKLSTLIPGLHAHKHILYASRYMQVPIQINGIEAMISFSHFYQVKCSKHSLDLTQGAVSLPKSFSFPLENSGYSTPAAVRDCRNMKITFCLGVCLYMRLFECIMLTCSS